MDTKRLRSVGATVVLAGFGLVSCSGAPDDVAGAGATVAAPATTTTIAGPVGTPAEAAAGFLQAWASGDMALVGTFVDAPKAGNLLADLNETLQILSREFTPRPVAPGTRTIPYTARITMKTAGVWTYESAVPVIEVGDRWKVAWSPSVIHPKLDGNKKLRLGSAHSTPGRSTFAPAPPAVPAPSPRPVVDRNGQVLTAAAHPSLGRILDLVTTAAGPVSAAPATTSPAAPATTSPVPDPSVSQVVLLVDNGTGVATPLSTGEPPPAPPTTTLPVTTTSPAPAAGPAASGIRTTFDAGIQTTAEQAVAAAGGPGAGLVVLDASTGHILAMASKGPLDRFATTEQPAASTVKVIVSAALLQSGLTPGSTVPCPASYVVPESGHTPFTNDDAADTNPAATLEFDLAKSCNTAFVQAGMRLPANAVATAATDLFGITTTWDIGLGSPRTYASVPAATSAFARQEHLIGLGEGGPRISPLAMASVAATVSSGTFRQPVLVPDVPGRATAGNLPANVRSGLQQMMRAVVTNGTATKLAGLGAVGAKTGTSGAPGNVGWMMAYRGNYAVAAVVTGVTGDANGNGTAGPVVARVLAALPPG